MSPHFSSGANVRIITERDQIGVVAGELRRMAGEDWYKVQFSDGRIQTIPGRNLEIYEGPQDVETLLCRGAFGNRETLTRVITITKTQRPLSNNIYSFRASRTTFHPHQIKPVLKYLDSPKNRLLIADEVGLGKTIEAGLILVEERARQELNRVLIVCPSALRQKWAREMKSRFDESFEILDSARFRQFLVAFEEEAETAFLRGIISIQTLRGEPLLEDIEARMPHFDLVIIDEAHHLRNPETFSHAAGRLLSECADSMLLLTATPVHLGNENLFYLLRLLDSEEFDEYSAFERRLRINEHIIRAQQLLGRMFPVDLSRCLDELRKVEQSAEKARFTQNPMYTDVLRRLKEYDGTRRDHVVELQRSVAALNLLGHVFTRSRKSEVQERRPVRRATALRREFSEEEMECYQEITSFAMHWYERRLQERGHINFFGQAIGADGFAAIMLKRQAASSLPALIEQTITAAESENETDMEELADSCEDEQAPKEVAKTLGSIKQDPTFQAIAQRYRELEKQDSKYERLVGAIRDLDQTEPGRKLIVFSFFKGTLRYLLRRLTQDGFACVLVHGDVPSTPNNPDTDERGKCFEKFEKDPRFRVLLSSEVGGEGLDLQFCHILFNYDLPWNPMVVEQRIGRLDRFGQASNSILIFNFSTPNTIEDRILYRLYQRINIFEHSIGDLEPILGSEVQELERKFLRSRMTPQEEEAEIERVASVLERKRLEMKELEAESERLIGHDEYFNEELERVRKLGRYLTPGELELLVSDFLNARFPRSLLQAGPAPGFLNLEARQDLLDFVRRHIDARDPLLLQFQSKALRGTIPVSFDSQIAFEHPEVEFLAVHHPLIRAIAEHYRQESAGLHPVSRVAISSDSAPEGTYLFLVYLLDVRGLRSRLQFEPVFIDIDAHGVLDQPTGESLLSQMVTNGTTLEVVPGLNEERIRELIKAANNTFGCRLAEIQVDMQATNDALVAQRLSSLEASYRVKLGRQYQRYEARFRKQLAPQYIRMIEGAIRRLESELDSKKREIEQSRRIDPRFELVAGGIVSVRRA
jgi:superfamily II DNA or RNA helicase